MRIGLAQINLSVGDIGGNLAKILSYMESARAEGVDVLCFPELAMTGYPPEDLLLKPSFIGDNIKAVDEVRKASKGLTVILGFADRDGDIYNAAALLHDGKLVDVYRKHYLPNYGVFDENRYFQSGTRTPVYRLGDTIFGVNICEDIWYPGDPTRKQSVLGGAQLIINISSSPYYMSKVKAREQMLVTRAKDYSAMIAYCNLVGGQDELVFDGHSVVIGERGEIIARGKGFEEDLVVADINASRVFRSRIHDPRRRKEQLLLRAHSEDVEFIDIHVGKSGKADKPEIAQTVNDFQPVEEEVFSALILGTRDYMRKNGFTKTVIGMSGGIDSALVAVIASEALGRENVTGVTMPSRYSSEGSVTDSEELARNIGIELLEIPIEKAFGAFNDMLSDVFSGRGPDMTEENLQARVRGNILMALSNKFGWLVLTTGNKSEMSVGYCTLYGDMAGGFAVIKDVPKTLVYRLSEYYNKWKGRDVIPRSILTKPPSAELRPGQLDTDSLPPYEALDPILKAYVEDDLSVGEIVSLGFPVRTVKDIIKMVDRNEYKRRQAPPGIKITARAFGKDRRFPITNLYRE
ncbi:MAG: NAD+ synthase [Candidatus Dadabacteria bacterium]